MRRDHCVIRQERNGERLQRELLASLAPTPLSQKGMRHVHVMVRLSAAGRYRAVEEIREKTRRNQPADAGLSRTKGLPD